MLIYIELPEYYVIAILCLSLIFISQIFYMYVRKVCLFEFQYK